MCLAVGSKTPVPSCSGLVRWIYLDHKVDSHFKPSQIKLKIVPVTQANGYLTSEMWLHPTDKI